MANPPRPSSLTLGTAALGMPYGIGNPGEKPAAKTVEAMLDQAWDGGITTFDTAPGYGEAEERLGRWIARRGITPHIATKLPSLAGTPDVEVAHAVGEAIRGSVGRLGVRPAIYLAHDAADYLRPEIRDRLHEAAARGDVGSVGVSVYTDAEVFAAIAAGPPDAIQLPVNAFDRRMVSSGALAACAAAGVAVFARSVFLQGAILMQPDRLPATLEALRAPLADFEAFCAKSGTSRASMALRHARDLPGITSTVIGAYSAGQIEALIAAASEPPLTPEQRASIESIASRVPSGVLDPRMW